MKILSSFPGFGGERVEQRAQRTGNFASLPDDEQIPRRSGVSDGNHHHVWNLKVGKVNRLNHDCVFVGAERESLRDTDFPFNGDQMGPKFAKLAAELNDLFSISWCHVVRC